LYHTDESVLLGAPTGSGKTISSELTMLRVFSTQPDRKIIYIAPLKVGVDLTARYQTDQQYACTIHPNNSEGYVTSMMV
jgi:Lhr-like helicase